MSNLYSFIAICPIAYHDTANRLAAANGNGEGNTYSLRFSPTGEEPATYCGTAAWAEETFLARVQGAAEGVLPDDLDLAGNGLTPEDVAGLLAVLVTDVRPFPQNVKQHLADVLAEQGLQEVRSSEIA